ERFTAHGVTVLESFVHGSIPLPLSEIISFSAKQLSQWNGSYKQLTEDLRGLWLSGSSGVVLAGTPKAAKNLAENLQNDGYPAAYTESLPCTEKGRIYVMQGALSAGFELPAEKFFLISYGQTAYRPDKKRRRKKEGQEIYNLSELSPGDFVVHSVHGIGVFSGIRKIDTHGVTKDYIKIDYAKGDVLYVPVTQLDMVAKYIGAQESAHVRLNRLGSGDWQRAKAKVKTSVKDIAKELIALYSARMKAKGYAFSRDNEWQRDFEAKFEYEETPDQLNCIQEIKRDMQRSAPMDRLLCGDVGFGKTEVALRAAFKCVSDSKQCALLCPTTILAWQHYQTVCKRFEGYPIRVELLSRFRTAKQQKETLEKLKRGEVDMVIGTHRLVQKDVTFRDLGLAIIDEEQRFGVQQKERFKELVKNVDVLTLSATPIPRTLNMAMSGLRDMSVLEEAPMNRQPVQTYVLEHDDAVINEAIRRELRRGGQVFYLHNNVDSISGVANRIVESIPEARVAIGHGKMKEQELSEVWRQMLAQEVDVLVCTTIIETGVDLPNANTLIIDNADCMGLSQLHQLRGRVGRSARRAYAYFTFRRSKVLSEIQQKRLEAIREFTEFGSGFKIAMRDLELRGAGNVMGAQQHGHMESVGYDMYLKLLGEAVREEKGELPKNDDLDCLI
ncbi:MAG: transcription-repair coupling factor, partial [Ruminococcus sp.]|nr:transcription-repair coupling factor [Ruminococcus sp.]